MKQSQHSQQSSDLPVLLDTCALLWMALGDEKLSNGPAKNKIEKAFKNNQLHLAAISLWEIAMLESKNRIVLNEPVLSWVTTCIQKYNLNIIPIGVEVAIESCHLPGGFHSDPSDRMIVATARVHHLTLVTQDQLILDYGKNGLLKVQNCF